LGCRRGEVERAKAQGQVGHVEDVTQLPAEEALDEPEPVRDGVGVHVEASGCLPRGQAGVEVGAQGLEEFRTCGDWFDPLKQQSGDVGVSRQAAGGRRATF